MKRHSRPTFEIKFKIDTLLGPEGWYRFRKHNGFELNFGLLYCAVWIQFVKSNYM